MSGQHSLTDESSLQFVGIVNHNKKPTHPTTIYTDDDDHHHHRPAKETKPWRFSRYHFTGLMAAVAFIGVLFFLFMLGMLTLLMRLETTDATSHIIHHSSSHQPQIITSASPPPPPIQGWTVQLPPPTTRTVDITFRMSDGVLVDVNDTSLRAFALNSDTEVIDMPALIHYTCCCNDHLFVVCDNMRPPKHATPEAVAATQPSLEDYSIGCYLTHDPSVPFANTETATYSHRWKVIIQYGASFVNAGPGATDCVFSITYHTNKRPPLPPPPPQSNSLSKKIW